MKRNKKSWTLTDAEMNAIACCLWEASESYADRQCNVFAQKAKDFANEIYDILDSIGYYSNSH